MYTTPIVAGDSLSRSWSHELAASLQGNTPAVDASHLYVGDMAGTFHALSRTDGSVVWSRNREGSLSDSSAYYHSGTVYVGSGGGAVYAFDAVDGTERWTYTGPSAVTSSPVVHDDTVYVGRNDGELLALATADGSVRWQTTLSAPIYSDLAYSPVEDAVIISTNGGGVHAHDAATGRELWSHSFGVAVGSSSPIVDDDRGLVYFAANELMAISVGSGTTAWGTSFYSSNAGSSPAVDRDRVYVGGGNGTVYAVSRPDGMLATAADWEYQSWDVSIVGDLTVSGGQLLVSSLDGGLYVLDVDAGTELASVELSCETHSSPVVVDGEVYVAGSDGTVFRFE
jgi:outer membrane protein assembly factor BamB